MSAGNSNDPTPIEDLSNKEAFPNALENDVFRQVYTKLDDEQVEQGKRVKHLAQDLWNAIDETIEDGERSEKARLVNIAKTQLEMAITMAIKGIFSVKE